MRDFLHSMRGEAGPRIARGAIKRLRLWKFWISLFWLAAWALVFWRVGAEIVRANLWMALATLMPLFVLVAVAGCCETQIRHLNDLAPSPYESGRMSRAGAVRMWIGNALMLLGLAVPFGIAPVWNGGLSTGMGIALGIAATLMTAGYVLSAYKTGLGWIGTPRGGPTYDPDTDEWTWFSQGPH